LPCCADLEENVLGHAERLSSAEADDLIEHHQWLVKLPNPELVSYPAVALVKASRHLIRHATDVPVLRSANGQQTGLTDSA
jgi:hypothetical protein